MKSVWVVSADPAFRARCRQLLPTARVVTSNGGDDQRIDERQVGAILYDLVHRDEWDDVTRLRRATQSYDIPFVVVTSWLWADGRSRQRARELQCTAVLAKPCPIESVLHVLLRAMDADTR